MDGRRSRPRLKAPRGTEPGVQADSSVVPHLTWGFAVMHGLRRASVTHLLHSSCTGWSQGAKIVFGACIVMQFRNARPGHGNGPAAVGGRAVLHGTRLDDRFLEHGVSLTAEAGGECP